MVAIICSNALYHTYSDVPFVKKDMVSNEKEPKFYQIKLAVLEKKIL